MCLYALVFICFSLTYIYTGKEATFVLTYLHIRTMYTINQFNVFIIIIILFLLLFLFIITVVRLFSCWHYILT